MRALPLLQPQISALHSGAVCSDPGDLGPTGPAALSFEIKPQLRLVGAGGFGRELPQGEVVPRPLAKHSKQYTCSCASSQAGNPKRVQCTGRYADLTHLDNSGKTALFSPSPVSKVKSHAEEHGEPLDMDVYYRILLHLCPCKIPWALHMLKLGLCLLSGQSLLPA